MPLIQNPEAVKFANERIRPIADHFAQLYYEATVLLNEYQAHNLDPVFVPTDTVDDGAAVDGRHVITGDDVKAMIVRAQLFVDDFNANVQEKLKIVLKPAVNPVR